MTNINDLHELMRIKEHVTKASREKTNLEGQLEQIKRRIGTEFGCASIEQAQAYVEELGQQAANLDREISEGVKALREELGW